MTKTDFDARLSSLNRKTTKNKSDHLLVQNELNKLVQNELIKILEQILVHKQKLITEKKTF